MCRDEGRALVLAWGGAGCWGHAPHPSPLPAEGTLHPDNPQHCLHRPASPLPSETPRITHPVPSSLCHPLVPCALGWGPGEGGLALRGPTWVCRGLPGKEAVPAPPPLLPGRGRVAWGLPGARTPPCATHWGCPAWGPLLGLHRRKSWLEQGVPGPGGGSGGPRGHSELSRSRLSVLSGSARAGERNLHISSMYIIFRRGRGESLGPLITFILLPLDCWLCM